MPRKKYIEPFTSTEKTVTWETTSPLLEAMNNQIQGLARKKPDVTLNPTKVAFVNRLLVDIKAMLADEADSKYLDLLDGDTLPQYGDVVLILSQYVAAMARFRSKYYRRDPYGEDDPGWSVG